MNTGDGESRESITPAVAGDCGFESHNQGPSRFPVARQNLDAMAVHSVKMAIDHLHRVGAIDLYQRRFLDDVAIRTDWWQAFKERWAPLWFRTLYPVIYTEVTASLRENYPNIKPRLGGRERVVFDLQVHRRDYPTEF
jgi:hypothetical protein